MLKMRIRTQNRNSNSARRISTVRTHVFLEADNS